jgi:hypothetical protein
MPGKGSETSFLGRCDEGMERVAFQRASDIPDEISARNQGLS